MFKKIYVRFISQHFTLSLTKILIKNCSYNAPRADYSGFFYIKVYFEFALRVDVYDAMNDVLIRMIQPKNTLNAENKLITYYI